MSSIRYQTVDRKIHKIDHSDDIKEIDYSDDIKEIDLSNKLIKKIIKINGLTNLQYLNLSANQITRIKGLDSLTILLKLDLTTNQITHIKGLDSLTNLQQLILSKNQITRIEGLDKLTSLQYLDLSENKITRIEGLEQLTSLQHIDLSVNQITRIEGLEQLTSLQHIDLSVNQITRIEGLDSLTSLQELLLCRNRITRIEGLESITALQELWFTGNHIFRIEGLDNLTTLQKLALDWNQITHIEGLKSLTALQILWLYGNHIKEVPLTIMLLRRLSYLSTDIEFNPIIRRFLSKNRIKSNRTVYDDPQNVHDSKINQSITQSLYHLLEPKSELSEEKVIGEILGDQILTKNVKEQIVEYVRITDVHSSLNVTFSEALRAVWQVIRKHHESDEIKKILNQEIDDSYCKCFTGRLSRLINSLNGFDPRVSVKISDQQEIANLIISVRQKTDCLIEQQKMVRQEMTDRGYDDQTVKEWIGYLE